MSRENNLTMSTLSFLNYTCLECLNLFSLSLHEHYEYNPFLTPRQLPFREDCESESACSPVSTPIAPPTQILPSCNTQIRRNTTHLTHHKASRNAPLNVCSPSPEIPTCSTLDKRQLFGIHNPTLYSLTRIIHPAYTSHLHDHLTFNNILTTLPPNSSRLPASMQTPFLHPSQSSLLFAVALSSTKVDEHYKTYSISCYAVSAVTLYSLIDRLF
jgi:hypothetical protein